ncbi:hypothetical protein Tco_0182519, partial [Tanacetum coccineum]
SLGSTSSNSSRDSIIPSVFPTFYKDVQAFYAKESPIPSPAPITPSHLEELSYHRVEKVKERFVNDRIIISGERFVNDRIIISREIDELKTKLAEIRSQLSRLQKKQLGQRDLISFTHFMITDLEHVIEEIRARQQIDQEDLQDAIYKLVTPPNWA